MIRVVQKNKQFLALLDFANLNVAFKTNLSVNKKVITPQSRIQKSLSNSELIILKSIALGLSCDTIRDLLEISKETYEKHCQNLFQKLDVCNAYAAVQKLSSKFYEFRLVHHNDTSITESPYYVRINNFGHRKTGWQTHNPIKVRMNAIGKLSVKDETLEFKKSIKSYS